jgi:glycosyltransferase involved in cell wall biosynthesis/peptidoglycan/xylan/chitin deacetylase (PgdA/CDA1 family)
MFLKQAFQLASPGGQNGRLSILIFHRVLLVPDPLFPDEPDIARFEQIVQWLKKWFNVLPLNEAVVRLQRGDLPPRAAAITFDDGYADNLVCAHSILRKHGLPATFFIATGFLDGGRMWNDTIIESIRGVAVPEIDGAFLRLGVLPLKTIEEKRFALAQIIPAVKHLPGEIRAEAVARIAECCKATLPNDLMLSTPQLKQLLAEGAGIGAHTVSHPILSRIDEAAARREIANSRDILEGILGERVKLFAYPNGRLGTDYSPAHASIVKSLGFDAAVATNWGVCTKASNLFQLPRFTPWDARRWRFGLRLLMNMQQQDVALSLGSASIDTENCVGGTLTTYSFVRQDGVAQRQEDSPAEALPLISVVIPCYNAENWIEATLRSVMAQDWPKLEIIVVDDGSTDRSVERVRTQFPSVTVLQQKNTGVAAARNLGIANANGDWIAFVDADDIWLPGKLHAQWQALSRQPDGRMAYAAWHVWPCTTPEPESSLLKELDLRGKDASQWGGPSGWIYPDLLEDCCVWTSTVLAHRSLFDEIGIFDEKLRIGEDYDLWLRASQVTPILRIPKPLALYRMHPDSITKKAPDINYQALVISRAINRWGYDSPDGQRAPKEKVDRALARTWRDFAGAHLVAGNFERARHAIFMSLRTDWRQLRGWKLAYRTILRTQSQDVLTK